MLDKETQSAIVNMSMDAETLGYCPEIMNIILTIIQSKTTETRAEIMKFLYSNQGSPLRLFLELMIYLPNGSNAPVISYKL